MRRRRRRALAAFVTASLGASAGLVGCSSGGEPAQLVVLIGGLPSGVPAAVSVSGGSFAQTLPSGAVLEVAPGSYLVEVAPAIGAEPIARTVFDGTASSTTVELGAGATATVEVAYARRAGTNRAWVRGAGAVHAFDVGAWEASGDAVSRSSLPMPEGFGQPGAFASSPEGDLYVALSGGGVARFAVADLDTDGAEAIGVAPVPAPVWRIAWHGGRLYAMGHEGQVVYRFDEPAAIVGDAVAGPDAAMTILGFEGGGSGTGLAFDDEGRLWVPLYLALVRIDEPWVPVGAVDVTPDAALTNVAGVRLGFLYRDGSLYLGHFDTNQVLRFDGVDAAVGTQPATPTAAITVDAFHVEAITVDASGRFWLSTPIPPRIARFPDLSTLAGGSAVTPNVEIGHGHSTALAFNATAID